MSQHSAWVASSSIQTYIRTWVQSLRIEIEDPVLAAVRIKPESSTG